MGDINIDIGTDSRCSHCSEFLNMLASHGILPGHVIPTHNKTCLDHTLIKTKLAARCLVLSSTVTDHNSTVLFFKSKPEHKPKQYSKRLDSIGLERDINKIDFERIYTFKDVNQAAEFFTNVLRAAISSNTKMVLTSRRKQIRKPWITSGILKCIRNRDNLYKKYKKDPDNDIIHTTYKRYRNYCCYLIKKTKSDYERIQLESTGNNKKKLWKTIKQITYITKPRDNSDRLVNASNPQLSVNDINEYFANIGKTLADKFSNPLSQTNLPKSEHPTSHLRSFALLPTDHDEVDTIIANLKSECAVGLDLISGDILKSFKHLVTPPITFICNLAFTTGTFPNIFKLARIKPIYKSGSRDCVNNYRPIAILPTLSKILERLMNMRLVKYLESNNLLSNNQYGFRQNKSTADAVHVLTEYLVDKLDSKKKAVAVFLDLAKAFDTVSVPTLIAKLEYLGIRGQQLNLFSDYLSNRTQCVQMGDFTSEKSVTFYGVPQGSILGPTLFLTYVNDLCNAELKNAKIVAFADDTALLFSGNSWPEVYKYAQEGFNTVNKWLRNNVLTLNTDKTKIVPFSLRDNPTQHSRSIISHSCDDFNSNDCLCPRLERVSSIKYLGVIIDSRLNFHQHIDLLAARIRKLIVIFKSLRHVSDTKLIKSVYYALCQSALIYCITSWGGSDKTHFMKIERAQRAILKVSHSLPFYYPTIDLYSKCKVMTVRQLYILFTVLKQHSDTGYFPERVYEKRRWDRVCTIRRFHTKFAHHFYCYQGGNLYNKLNQILQIYDIPKGLCKHKVKSWLLSLDYNFTEQLLD